MPSLDLFMRVAESTDAAALADFTRRNYDRLVSWLPVPPAAAIDEWAPRAIDDSARATAAGTEIRLMLFSSLDDGRMCGHVSLTRIDRAVEPACMLSYAIDRAEEGRGLMRSAVSRAVDWAFAELAIGSIGARYHPANVRSARLLASLGFREDAAHQRHAWLDEVTDHLLVVRRA